MKENEKMDGLREEYISTMAELASLGIERATNLPSDMGIFGSGSSSNGAESQKLVETINKKIADTCNKLRSIEQRGRGEIGVPVLFGQDVPNVIRLAVSILVGKSISGRYPHETRRLGDFLMPVGGNCPKDLLTIREAFRKTGLLRPHVHCSLGRTIDEIDNLTLTESSFRQLLALEPDSECGDLYKARELVSASALLKR